MAIYSEFEWVVRGPAKDMASGSSTPSVHLLIGESDHPYSTPMKFACKEDESELSNSLRRFWEIESMGITEKEVTKEEFLKDIRYIEDTEVKWIRHVHKASASVQISFR